MSPRGSSRAGRRVAVAKPKNDVYVGLLGIALLALIAACILMAMELGKYDWKVKPPTAQLPAAPGMLEVASSRADYLGFSQGNLLELGNGPGRLRFPR